MQTFKYRLQQLLDLKIEHRSRLRLSVMQCEKELAAEEEELARLRCSENELQEKLIAARPLLLAGAAGATGLAIQQHRDYLSGLTIDLGTARDSTFSQQLRVQESIEKLAQARCKLTGCLREIDVLTKHRDRLQQRFHRAVEMREAAEHDEIGTSMFLRSLQASGNTKQERSVAGAPSADRPAVRAMTGRAALS